MSLKMMALVWELALPPTQKFVLMAIAAFRLFLGGGIL